MHLYLNFFNFKIPSYGFMIALGLVVSNICLMTLAKKKQADINDIIIIEAYSFLGGMVGAKILYLIISWNYIDWKRLLEFDYFLFLMNKGFVFYGGLICGIFFAYLAYVIHKLPVLNYMRKIVFLVPLTHAFGRIGCFLAGCCYGIPCSGCCAVVFPKNSFALSGVSLFPVQIVESFCLFIIAGVIFILILKNKEKYTILFYVITYSVLRFVLEFLRFDSIRGKFLIFSTSQWISVFLFVFSLLGLFIVRKRAKKHKCNT